MDEGEKRIDINTNREDNWAIWYILIHWDSTSDSDGSFEDYLIRA